MQLAETVVYWLGVIGYALSFGLFAVSLIFDKARLSSHAVFTIQSAFALHTAALTLRWIQTGHPPFVSFFESASAAAWFGVLGYMILENRSRAFRPVGIGVAGIVFLLLGWASTPSYAGEALSAGLQSTWLFIHASFATAGVGCFIVAAGVSMVWLRKLRRVAPDENNDFFPSVHAMDEMVFRFIFVGFLFYSVMVVSGAVWANQAWGRYWGWDPIETWSLITWLIYALYIHAHFTFKRLRGKFTAWYAIIALLFAAFSLWGVGYLYETIHLYG